MESSSLKSMDNFLSKLKEAQQWLGTSLQLNNPKNTKFYKYENELYDFFEIKQYNAWKTFIDRSKELQKIKKEFYNTLHLTPNENLIQEFEIIYTYLSKFIETFNIQYLSIVSNQMFKFHSIFNNPELNLSNHLIAIYKIFYEKLKGFVLYVQQNNSFIHNELSVKYLDLLQALKECTDLLKIFNVFKNETSKDFLERLKIASSGKTIQNYDISTSDRNYLFELLINAYFKKSGFNVCFNNKADVIATKGEFTIIGECKKVTSEDKLEANINKAGKQLAKNLISEISNSYGLIFVDISNCLFKKENLSKDFYVDGFHGVNYLEQSFQNFINNYKRIIEELNNKYQSVSLGICFFATITLPTIDSSINYTTKIHIITAENILDEDFLFIKKELASFEGLFFDIY